MQEPVCDFRANIAGDIFICCEVKDWVDFRVSGQQMAVLAWLGYAACAVKPLDLGHVSCTSGLSEKGGANAIITA
ncbi:hypothetical protein IGS59_27380 [Janthinobacterium sp. GW460P]|uniref:hypothetical protein n=1 Tax=unclassified Janthinobacterium TaxID=2610881 RepID=UPI00111C90C2|nr:MULTISPECIES: hypothetical protein [unclassified Janthinobacterium]MCC7705973.1 hypothetical protein [Janthinobacterium sp. GW460P]MCC7711475.1 hypothetical protein [Janthinobacterium sp. GW460W]